MQAITLKYRPKSYDDLIGQSTVSKSLKFALDNQQIANAYLFSGLRGSGKTSSARILARCLNCKEKISSSPCMHCENCLAQNPSDVYELDAASNRGIESIQELIENTKFTPMHSRFKIFIIDEVHMLTKEAFNALLKTLEEPPSYVKFILATTDPNKIPATILSRVLHFRFKAIASSQIANRMKFILDNEKINYEEEALFIIARSANGSLRDALTLLEQAIIYSQNNVNTINVSTMLGIIDTNIIKNFFADVLRANDDGIFKFLELAKEYEVNMILDEMSAYLKQAFFNKDRNFSLLLYERFFAILSKARYMAKISDDDEFNLCVMAFMLKEACYLKEVDEEIVKIQKEENKNTLFDDFVRQIQKRDYKLGLIFTNNTTFVSQNESEFVIKVNPKNEEEKNYFKQLFAVVKDIFASLDNSKKLVITSDYNQNNTQNNNSDDKDLQAKNKIANIQANLSISPKNYEQEEKEQMPEMQSDDFLSDDYELELDNIDELMIPEEALINLDDNVIDIILSAVIRLEIENNTLLVYVNPPYDEVELNILRANLINVIKKSIITLKLQDFKVINIQNEKKK